MGSLEGFLVSLKVMFFEIDMNYPRLFLITNNKSGNKNKKIKKAMKTNPPNKNLKSNNKTNQA